MSFQRVTPTGLRRQCVLDDLADYDADTTYRLTHDVEALDAEVERWIRLRHKQIKRLVGIGSNALISMANGSPVAEERALAYSNIEHYRAKSEAFMALITDCPALAYPYTNRDITEAEFVYRLRIIELGFEEADETMQAIYTELNPSNGLQGKALQEVVRDWEHEHLDALTEISRMLAVAEGCGDGHYGTVAAVRASLTQQLQHVSAAALSLLSRSPTLRGAVLEPPASDNEFTSRMNQVVNALIP